MSLETEAPTHAEKCFPRVSGDEPVVKGEFKRDAPFSPRERG